MSFVHEDAREGSLARRLSSHCTLTSLSPVRVSSELTPPSEVTRSRYQFRGGGVHCPWSLFSLCTSLPDTPASRRMCLYAPRGPCPSGHSAPPLLLERARSPLQTSPGGALLPAAPGAHPKGRLGVSTSCPALT